MGTAAFANEFENRQPPSLLLFSSSSSSCCCCCCAPGDPLLSLPSCRNNIAAAAAPARDLRQHPHADRAGGRPVWLLPTPQRHHAAGRLVIVPEGRQHTPNDLRPHASRSQRWRLRSETTGHTPPMDGTSSATRVPRGYVGNIGHQTPCGNLPATDCDRHCGAERWYAVGRVPRRCTDLRDSVPRGQ